MKTALKTDPVSRLTLNAETASDLMTPDPVSIRDVATVREAIALLTDRGFSAAPVIDQTGKPVGVLSRSDILVHDREKIDHVVPVPEYYETSDLATRSGEKLGKGFQVENCDATVVRDIMTPVVFSVPPDAPARPGRLESTPSIRGGRLRSSGRRHQRARRSAAPRLGPFPL
jgi:CBS domain-containing protein